MAGYRGSFIKTIHRVGKLIPTQFLITTTGQNLIFPFYHTISDSELPHIKHLYTIKGVSEFIQDLDFLLKHFRPVDYFQVQDFVLNKKHVEKPSFFLSFDDGLREFYDVIAPILVKKGIPAACFLNSAFIDNKGLFFRYKVSLLINYINQNEQLLLMPELQAWIKVNFPDKKGLSENLLYLRYRDKHLLDQLANLVNYSFDQFLLYQKPYLTRDQVISLKQQGFYFGAHSVDHPEYRFMSLDQQLSQTKESVECISSSFSLNYRCFSFPFTDYQVSQAFFERIYKDRIVDLSFGCAGIKHEAYKRHQQRLSFEMDNLSAKEIINSELIYYMLKSPLGKNRIKRL